MKFSIIIPTRHRPAALRACLRSIAALDYPRSEFEVLVVDDGGGVPRDVEQEFAPTINLRLVGQPHMGPATARNRGMQLARGEYLAFTDDDCLVAPGWLSALERALQAHPRALVGGATCNAPDSSIYAVASQNIIDFLYEYYASARSLTRFFASNNLGVRRDLLLSVGGFDETFPRAAAEDRELCERWQEAEGLMHFAEDAQVTHVIPLSFARYVRQHWRYGQGADHLQRARQRRGHSHHRPRIEPLRFYMGLVAFPLRRRADFRAVGLMLLAMLSQVIYGLAYYLERGRFALRAPAKRRPVPSVSMEAIAEPPPSATQVTGAAAP
jgi:glycosyltransferase involved in cell wall biosynthesis